MNPTVTVTEIRHVPAGDQERERGLLGFLSVLVNGALRIDGIAVRRTMGGKLTLAYPRRQSRAGAEHYVVRPITDAAREAIERQVFEALDLGEAAP